MRETRRVGPSHPPETAESVLFRLYRYVNAAFWRPQVLACVEGVWSSS